MKYSLLRRQLNSWKVELNLFFGLRGSVTVTGLLSKGQEAIHLPRH